MLVCVCARVCYLYLSSLVSFVLCVGGSVVICHPNRQAPDALCPLLLLFPHDRLTFHRPSVVHVHMTKVTTGLKWGSWPKYFQNLEGVE